MPLLQRRPEPFKAGGVIKTHGELGPAARTFVRLDSLRTQDLLISVKDSSSEILFFVPVGDPLSYFQVQL